MARFFYHLPNNLGDWLLQAQSIPSDDSTKIEKILNFLDQLPIIELSIPVVAVEVFAVVGLGRGTDNANKVLSFGNKYFGKRPLELSEKLLLKLRSALLQQMRRDVAQPQKDSLHNLNLADLAREKQLHQIRHASSHLGQVASQPFQPARDFIRRGVAIQTPEQEIAPTTTAESTYIFFHRNGIEKQLLILGNPGAGKSTELPTVSQRLVEEADDDGH